MATTSIRNSLSSHQFLNTKKSKRVMYLKIAIMIFVIQLNAVKTYGPVRSIDDLVREVSKAVSESLIAMSVRISLVCFKNPKFDFENI